MPKIVNHETRREDIARAAFRVIRRKGVAKATIRDIARESGCSVGAVVHYITSKDHIFLQAAEYSTLIIREKMERAEHSHEGIEALRQVLYQGLPADDEMLGHWKIWFGFWQLSETSELIRAATHDRYDEFLSTLRPADQSGAEGGRSSQRHQHCRRDRRPDLPDGRHRRARADQRPPPVAAQIAPPDRCLDRSRAPRRREAGSGPQQCGFPARAAAGLNAPGVCQIP